MNVLDEIAALESEIADTNARIDKVNAEVEAIKRKTIEIRNRVSKIEEDAQKQISDPNFPEAEKQRSLRKCEFLRVCNSRGKLIEECVPIMQSKCWERHARFLRRATPFGLPN